MNKRNKIASLIIHSPNTLEKWDSRNLFSFNANNNQCWLISSCENENFPGILYGSKTVHFGRLSRISGLSWNELISLGANSIAGKIGYLFRCKRFFMHLQLSILPLILNMFSICGEGPRSILLPLWMQFRNDPSSTMFQTI